MLNQCLDITLYDFLPEKTNCRNSTNFQSSFPSSLISPCCIKHQCIIFRRSWLQTGHIKVYSYAHYLKPNLRNNKTIAIKLKETWSATVGKCMQLSCFIWDFTNFWVYNSVWLLVNIQQSYILMWKFTFS